MYIYLRSIVDIVGISSSISTLQNVDIYLYKYIYLRSNSGCVHEFTKGLRGGRSQPVRSRPLGPVDQSAGGAGVYPGGRRQDEGGGGVGGEADLRVADSYLGAHPSSYNRSK